MIIWAVLALPGFAVAQVRTEMKLFSDSFISPEFEATQKNNYQFIGAAIKTEPFSDSALKMDISGGVAVGSPLLNYLNISELYVQTRQSESDSFFIGRKKMLWSELDARWELGVWEPLFKWNPLAPDRQGLSGIFWQTEGPAYSFTLFASPLYIPSQGPSFEIEGGDFVRGNPWFHQPPSSVRIWDEATQMQYNMNQPNTSEVVLQNSYGAKIAFGDPNGLKAQLSYMYKPDNTLAIGYQGSLDLSTLKGNVELRPQVFYHSLAGADLTYKAKKWRTGISAILDRPSKENLFDEPDWTQPVFEDAVLVSPFFEWDNGWWAFNLMRLDIYGGKVKEVGADLANEPLTNLYPFYEANQVSLLTNFSLGKARRLITKFSFTASDKNDFQLFRLNSRLRLSGLWSFFGEMQMLKAGPTTKDNQNEMSQFANNDRLMVGAAYVF
ncbi:hypothetical protein [Bdellovibrio sp. HCB209]|uniref:hypothetical protein n=1 Tax=Bdellovibrio sp. HCB209 TaxID=3394354 RepID=UPI0039B629C5